jgi:hypothetical protein
MRNNTFNLAGEIATQMALVFSALLTVLAIGCSSSFPSESDGRKVAESIGEKEGYTVKSFSKTNAVDHGVAYVLEFEAEVECERVNDRNCYEGPPTDLTKPYVPCIPRSNPGADKLHDISCFKVGETHKFNSSMEFQKTEKGWRGPDGQIY